MRSRPRLLKQLIDNSIYVVDEPAVAKAVLARASVRASVAEPAFRSESVLPVARSFRRQRDVRSFRLVSPPSHRRVHH